MSDGPDPEAARAVLAERFEEAGLDTRRFIDVEDGEKESHNHKRYEPDSRRLSGNYGVYGGPYEGDDGGGLIDVDVDDYNSDAEASGLEAVNGLPDTFSVESPHTDGDQGGHRYYRVIPGDEYETAEAASKAATGSANPDLSWGEVRVDNQYVVGPGSQLDGCDKDWCEECAKSGSGYYRIAADRPVATITADEFYEVLDADPTTTATSGASSSAPTAPADDLDLPAPEIAGDGPDELPVCYAAALKARTDPPDEAAHAHALNRDIAILGVYAGYDADELVDHFEDNPLYGDPSTWDRGKTATSIRGTIKKIKSGGLHPPSEEKLRELGVFDAADECNCRIHNPDHETAVELGRQRWEAWTSNRLDDDSDVDESSIIPTAALRYIADRDELYNFEALSDEVKELPPKAHNRALWWVKNRWPATTDALDADDEVTARGYRDRDASAETWEDVRYIYENDKNAARHAAEGLLREARHFATVDETDTLLVYDSETGVYADSLAGVKSDLKDGLGQHWTTHEVNEILARLRQKPRPSTDDLNGAEFDTPHICVANGVLDLFEREQKPHSPEHYFTDRVPVAFDADAETEPYDEFLDSLVDRDADREALVEMVGHALTPDAYERRWKKFLMLSGATNNGKSVFFDRVRSLLNGPDGDEANTANVKLAKIAQNRFSNNSMLGKLANVAGEVDGKKIRNTASIKDITGGDPVEIEPKGEDSFFTALNSTFMFAANDPPIIGERDKEAVATRLVPIHLPYTFVDDPQAPKEKQAIPEAELKDQLDSAEALSGFLNLALDGIERLRENNGDVSLPESDADRLRKYERNADPMREFGERCLENSDGDYVVKADVTTMYKEFATDQGHEVGQNVSRVLHDVLRGVSGLNYTDSRPESPDYTDTSLPLRGWNERKRVVNRVTLTDEGKQYARAAGLVVEDGDDADTETPKYLSAGEVEASAAASDREKVPPVRGAVTAVWQNRYGQPVTELKDEDGSIDIQIEGFDSPDTVPLSAGVTYEIDGLRYRKPDDGRAYYELRPTTTVEVVDRPEGQEDDNNGPDTDADSADTAAADGGTHSTDGMDTDTDSAPPADAQGRRADAQRVAEELRVEGVTGADSAMTAAAIAPKVDMDPDTVRRALEYGASETTPAIFARQDGSYWLLASWG